jgi:hypothetical protein
MSSAIPVNSFYRGRWVSQAHPSYLPIVGAKTRQENLTAEANKAARKLTAICEKSSEGKDKQQEQERVWKAAEPKSKIQFTGVGGLPA